ncbi:ChrR family anti-sigma-E factor [Microbulbifer hainanensis]|uniref:ChrR family anti-sigma-E factor n=1 Tax=Microbulbifer hainanensis TaxID=2735675 RepID=UPI001865A8FE|nr:ChrR family anti-sigma-E factor [Microbulbifer hainanensis]
MIRHHPDQNMLLEYAAGNLPWAVSLSVSAHLQLCPQCRRHCENLNHLGGNLLDDSEPQPTADDALQRLLDRIEVAERQSAEEPRTATDTRADKRGSNDPALANLPRVIDKLVRNNWPLKWQRVSPALKMSRLKSGQDRYEVAFHRIGRGGKTAEHDHRGQEVVLVLHGRFSDADGVYGPGDFLVREPGEVHRPIATQDQECLCFSVVEAPVAVTGLLGWLVNPFLSFRPG